MTDTNMTPLSPPQPEKKDTVTFNKKNLAIAFLAVVIAALLLIVIIPTGDDKQTSTPATTERVFVTNPPQTSPPSNKYDDYMNHVLNNSGQANTWSKAELIEFGDLVCQALDNGNTISGVVNLLNSYAETTSDAELFASVMIGSIMYLCPEYNSDLQYYLGDV